MDHNSEAHIHQTDFFETPPAKKPRLEIADTTGSTDIAGPTDDMDDIYDTPQACASPQRDERPAEARTSEEKPLFAYQSTFILPGLGMANVVPTNGKSVEKERSIFEQVQVGQEETPASQKDSLTTSTTTKHEDLVGSDDGLSVDTGDRTSAREVGESSPMLSQDVVEDRASLEGGGGANGEEQANAITGQSGGQGLGDEVTNGSEVVLESDHPQEAKMLESVLVDANLAKRLPEEVNAAEIATTTKTSTLAQALIPAGNSLKLADLSASMNEDAKTKVDKHASFEHAEVDQNSADPEFELDSSPIVSSSSDDSSDSSSSDSDDYEMLDPEEQARRLMQEDGGSDDEAGKRGGNAAGGDPLRTLNEKPDEEVQKPNVVITPEMKIKELGHAENLVENIVLIKANTSGEYQVLETGSVLCLEDRTVIGVVAETLGRVQQPLYSVRFTNATAISEAGIARGTRIFYVEQHSTYVFTQPLKASKGSDASNLHDEEVGEDELEFSDDEAEAEHKRRLKMQRQAKRGGPGGVRDGGLRGSHQNGSNRQSRPAEVPISYDDAVDGNQYDDHKNGNDDELYTPLARPSNLHEMMAQRVPPLEGRPLRDGSDRGIRGGRGQDERGRGRGDRGRGHRGGRNDRGERRDSGDMRYYSGRNDGGAQHPRETNGRRGGMQSQKVHQDPHSMSPAQSTPASSCPPQGSAFTPHTYQPQYTLPFSQTPPQHPYTPSPNFLSQPYLQQQGPQQPYHPSHQSYGHAQQHPPQEPYGQAPNPPLAAQNKGIPAGAFVNPAFFGNLHRQPSMPRQRPAQQQWMSQPAQSQRQPGSYGNGPARMSPETDAAFRAAQDRLNVLRQLSQGSGPPS